MNADRFSECMLIAFLIRCALVQICREGAVLWEGGLPTDCMLIALPHCMLIALPDCMLIALPDCMLIALSDCMLIALPHCMLTSRASACGLWAGAHPSCGAAATRALWNPMIENALLPSPPLAYVQTKPASEQLGDANTARLEDERRYAQYGAA